ncbi:MAG: hypothetical protein JWP19_1174 [Rhodoglobus sp.]|nr:hypothetical protein [Rhodoglobus sp.]
MSTTVTHEPHTPWGRLIVAGIGLAVVLSVLVLAFLWPTVTASVKNLPIAVVGDAATTSQLENALEQKSPGTFDFREAADRAAAEQLIETRDVYGAIVLGASPEVLISTASSPVAAQLLSGLAPALQAQLNAAVAAQGIQLPSPIVVTVTDVVPLASTDARGTALAASSFPLVLGGMIGGIAISLAVVGVWRRVTAVLVYSVVGGLALAGIMQGQFGALQGSYLVNSAAIALALLSISGVIVGFVSLFGPAGVAVGPVVYLLIANPISSAAQPYQFLAEPWGAVGQWFPPGAAATLLRELSYFPKADTTFPWLVLAAWAVGGLLIALLGHFRNTGAATRAALEVAEAAS